MSQSPPHTVSGPDVQMSDDEIAAYLRSRGDGVLTLHVGDGQSFPVSFGYDSAADRCVFQFLSTADSATRDLDDETPATLVAYDIDSPDDWTSVVVDGRLVEIPGPGADERRTYAEQATAIGMSVFDADPAELDAAWYELRPTDASGRQSP
ncbi:pyridoxamine 5'-phosphate oxidase family protein [Halobacterium sp. R2-5]|uniref:pyridoxamine 5'-phosphate oxidase family protein n=1 Tax=Halobacterium sp. R2-5 TaxID=2715751 RepID=UPI001424865D|nr:pyridoxamine 5'-phosphate oxidase family protein [Halobacterium sp. R2-5]NIC00502.1 pyridoxamine 5'-phosphate oxidase family protein [Halobacterium sp. R2-5]